MNAEDFMTSAQAAEKWGITVRRAQVLCAENRVDGAFRVGKSWILPADAKKPADARIKSRKYIKKKGR
ncbi:MAG: DNA-binding protein [Clostridia bacterium]|nr:DNA-binding protein [Clostridia bacterium]